MYTAFFVEPLIPDKQIFQDVTIKGKASELCVPCFDSFNVFAFKGILGQAIGEYCVKKADEGVRV
jgi:hypothetical protein